MKLNGSQIIMECLKEQHVDTVFGYPGGTILNVYDAIYQTPEIHHILTSHEQGAAHAADGYARATGKVGVCMATSGPGASNLVTGIATANMDSVPVVAITANVGSTALGKDGFQELDIVGVTMPITKYSTIVKNVKDLAPTLRRAFKIAMSGRKGPVLVDITKDVTAAECEYTYEAPEEILPVTDTICADDLKEAAELINKSKKPFMFVGGGCICSDASEEVRKLQKLTGAFVCDSLQGKGAYPGTDDHYTGMLSMHGTKASNLGMYKCDLLIVLGSRFSDRCVGDVEHFANQAKILQIDIDEAEINKNVQVDCAVIGDVKEALKQLLPLLKQHDPNPEWDKTMMDIMEKSPLVVPEEKLSGPFVVEEIYRQTKGDAIICTDVGQHQMWAAQFYKYTQPRTLLSSGGLGTMGYGLGAAIGAKFGRPDKTVINIAGDGCFRMNMNELATASRNHTHIIEIVINNSVLGMVHQWQELFYGERYSQTVFSDNIDFVKVAEGLGCTAYRAKNRAEFTDALAKALAADGPVFIDACVDFDDKVFPMVPAGKANLTVFDASDLAQKQ